jgi:catechol 2,3-dioxygenase-like lactoylglutathione lyase family enzyme
MKRTRFEGAEPILNVADMGRSVRYYVDVLGFANADWGGDDFTHVSRDDAGIYLSQGDQGHPGTWVWIGVEDVASLYQEYTERGPRFYMRPPTTHGHTK